jgi:protein arginine kinase activator
LRCQICQKNQAVIHTLDLVEEDYVSRFLCEQCAHGHGDPPEDSSYKVIKFFGEIMKQQGAPAPLGSAPSSGQSCPGCGMSQEQFQQHKRLGCARCYESFQLELEQIFLRVQEHVLHRGKVPARPKNAPPSPLELKRLREHLSRAIEEERFEEAALYRDKIVELTQEDEGSEEGEA